MASAVYVLCAVTSGACAILLLREYSRTAARLLLWSGLSFIGFALNNVLVFADYVVVPDVDLSLVRAAVACAAISLLLFGLVTETS